MYSPRRRTRSISLEMLAGIVLLLVVLAFLLGFLLGGRSMKHRMEAEEDSVVRTVRETVAEAAPEGPEKPSAEIAKAAETTKAETTEAAETTKAAERTKAAESTKAAERTKAAETTKASETAASSGTRASTSTDTVEPRALPQEDRGAAEAAVPEAEQAAEAAAPEAEQTAEAAATEAAAPEAEQAAEAAAPSGQAELSAAPGTAETAATETAAAAETTTVTETSAAPAETTAASAAAAENTQTAAPASLARPEEGPDPVSYTVESTVLKASPLIGVAAGQVLSPSEINVSKPEDYTQILSIKEGDYVYNRINGKSWRPNPDIALEDLRYIKVLHYNYDGNIQVGEMIVNKDIQQDMTEIFEELFRQKYQVSSMHLIDDYWQGTASSSGSYSIDRNNTSVFRYSGRNSSGKLSNHALGLAIDFNPQQNPYVTFPDGTPHWSHENASAYVDRSAGLPHMIDHNDLAYRLFTAHGFTWGGDQDSPKDYQLFAKAR